jgi:hypothetical protein
VSVRLLAFHAPYRCRHRGVCCAEPWAIPVERVRHRRILEAVRSGALRMPHGPGGLFETAPGVDVDADVVVGRRKRECVFRDAGGGLCAVHRDMGHGALPSACQHFPRVVTLDPRGVSLSLSFVCPTAADLLFDARPGWHEVVHDGAVVLRATTWEGLDAREPLPPQVNETLLWDWDSMTAFERETLKALSESSPEHALGLVDAVAARLDSASAGPLESVVRTAFLNARRVASELDVEVDALLRLAVASSTAPPPGDWTGGVNSPAAATVWRAHGPQVSRYLASRLMASAVVYHARSARVWSGWLQTAYAVLRRSVDAEAACGHVTARQLFTAALARSDRLLVHGVDAARLAASLHGRSALPS